MPLLVSDLTLGYPPPKLLLESEAKATFCCLLKLSVGGRGDAFAPTNQSRNRELIQNSTDLLRAYYVPGRHNQAGQFCLQGAGESPRESVSEDAIMKQ